MSRHQDMVGVGEQANNAGVLDDVTALQGCNAAWILTGDNPRGLFCGLFLSKCWHSRGSSIRFECQVLSGSPDLSNTRKYKISNYPWNLIFIVFCKQKWLLNSADTRHISQFRVMLRYWQDTSRFESINFGADSIEYHKGCRKGIVNISAFGWLVVFM